MSFIVQPERRRQFPGLAEAITGGFQQGQQDVVDERASKKQRSELDEILSKVQNQGVDFPTALLQSNLSLEDQNLIAKQFQQQEELNLKRQDSDLLQRLFENEFVDEPSNERQATPQERRQLEEPVAGEPQDDKSLRIEDIPDSKLVVMRSSGNERVRRLADAELDRRKEVKADVRATRDFASKRSLPFLLELDKSRDDIREREFSGKLMIAAIEDGDLDFFSGDNLASATGFGLFRTAKGQQFITAGKDYFLSDIQRAGTRPNQWIEQQIQEAMAQIGTSKQAQLTAAKTQLASTQLKKEKKDLADRIIAQYEERGLDVPGNIAAIVDEQMRPIADDIQRNLALDLRIIHESELTDKKIRELSNKRVSAGTPLTPRMAKIFIEKNNGDKEEGIRQAKRLGYTILTPDQFNRYTNSG